MQIQIQIQKLKIKPQKTAPEILRCHSHLEFLLGQVYIYYIHCIFFVAKKHVSRLAIPDSLPGPVLSPGRNLRPEFL